MSVLERTCTFYTDRSSASSQRKYRIQCTLPSQYTIKELAHSWHGASTIPIEALDIDLYGHYGLQDLGSIVKEV